MNRQSQDGDKEHYTSPTSTVSPEYETYDGFSPTDENLPEVVVDSSPQALTHAEAEHVAKHLEEREPKYPAITDNTPKVLVTQEDDGYNAHSEPVTPGTEGTLVEKRRICGLKRKVFFILLLVLLIVIAAAIGGGVGGSASAAKRGDAAAVTAGQETSSSSSTPTMTQSHNTTTSTTTSASPTVTFLNNQTLPDESFAFQGFSGANYSGKITEVVRKEGGSDFDFEINSYVWLRNKTWCCVSFCKNATDEGMTGYRCDDRYRDLSSGPFTRVFVWCGLEQKDENAKCR